MQGGGAEGGGVGVRGEAYGEGGREKVQGEGRREGAYLP